MRSTTENRVNEFPMTELKVQEGRPIVNLLIALRPLHWVKNIFIFTALIFSRQLFLAESIRISLLAFGIFCSVSSAVYLINDVFDREEDARHPSKYRRPITCGLVSAPRAIAVSILLTAVSVALAFGLDTKFGWVVVTYSVMNILYSIRLKKIVIMDVVIIALGFVFRVMAGFYCLNYELSNWVLICTFFLSAFIAFSKRRYEIMFDGSSVQFTRGYSPYLLDLLVLMSAGSAISSYVFYVLSRGNWQIGVPLLLSILPVFYGVVRYVMVIHRSEEKLDHTQLILSYKPLLISVLIWIALCIIEIYYIRANMTL
jgi:4-hydroxybenzoate polyprenyltransferase